MKQIVVSSAACVVLGMSAIGTASAAPTTTLTPAQGHPSLQFGISGTGFGANKLIDIYWDTTDELLVTSDSTGAFASHLLPVPASALPGTHWVTAGERDNGNAAQAAFTVRTNWTEYGFGAAGRRFNPFENVISTADVDRLNVAWTYTTGGAVESSPAVAGGVVYVGSDDGKLYALNPATGAKKWSATTGGAIGRSSPAVYGTTVYVGSGDDFLWAFNTATGALKWKFQTSGVVLSSPTVIASTVYVGSEDGNLYALNATTGALKWTAAPGVVISAPAVADGNVYVTSVNHSIDAYNTSTGAAAWSLSALDLVQASPSVAYGRVFAGSADGNLYALDTFDGSESSTSYGGSLFATAAAAYGRLYFTNDNNNFRAVTANFGSVWLDNIGTNTEAAPAIANGVVYLAANNLLEAFDADTGAALWVSVTGFNQFSSPAVSDGMVYVGATDHRLYAFAIDGGNNPVYRRDAKPPRMEQLHPNRKLKIAR